MSDHISFLLYDLGNSHLYVTIHTIVLREVLLTLGLQLNRNLINCECTISSSHHHLSPNRESWGITDDFTTSFFHFSLFSTAPRDFANSRPVHSLMSSHLFLCLPCLFPLSPCLARWFWSDLMNGRHDHITAVCVSLRSSGLHVVQLPAGSSHGLQYVSR